jgi:hypothetical protein
MRTKIAYFILVMVFAGCAASRPEDTRSPTSEGPNGPPTAGSASSDIGSYDTLTREQADNLIRNDPRFLKTLNYMGTKMDRELLGVSGVILTDATTATATFTWRLKLLPGQSPPGAGIDLDKIRDGQARFQKSERGWQPTSAVNPQDGNIVF